MARRTAPATKKTASKRAPAAKKGGGGLGAETRIGVLHGSDAFLRALRTDEVRDALRAAHGEVEVVRFQGGEASVADVLDECRSFGLMQQHKLVIVDDADQFVKDQGREIMERYAAAPAEQATLLLRGPKWNKGKLDKLIEKVGAIIKCDMMAPPTAAAWARQRISKRHDAEIAPDAARSLVERVGTELGRLDSELQKLAAAAASRGTRQVTLDLVHELVQATAEEEVWSIQSRLLEGDAEHAARGVREALEVSRHPATLVNWAMIDLARKLHSVSRLIEQGSRPFDAGRAVKLWDNSLNLVIACAQRAAPDQCAALMHEAIEVDRRSKTGATEHGLALERLAVRFASLTR